LPNSLVRPFVVSLYALAFAAGVIISCAPSASAAPAAEGASAKSAIEAVYDEINASFERRDLPLMMSYFTPDYTEVDEKGKRHNKESARQGYQKQLGQIKSIQSRYSILNVTPSPGGTLVEMKLHSDGVGVKRVLFARLKGTFVSDLHVRDLWVKTPQGWRLQHRQTLENNLKIHPG
jgi:ketosteroid isomerase-like protein